MESISTVRPDGTTYMYAAGSGDNKAIPPEEFKGASAVEGAAALNELLVTREFRQTLPTLKTLSKGVKILDGLSGCYEFLTTVRQDINENGQPGLKSLGAMFGAVAKSATSSVILLSAPAIVSAGAIVAGPLGAGAAIGAVGAGLYYLPEKASSLAKSSRGCSWLLRRLYYK